jgi:hypothetical protein
VLIDKFLSLDRFYSMRSRTLIVIARRPALPAADGGGGALGEADEAIYAAER